MFQNGTCAFFAHVQIKVVCADFAHTTQTILSCIFCTLFIAKCQKLKATSYFAPPNNHQKMHVALFKLMYR